MATFAFGRRTDTKTSLPQVGFTFDIYRVLKGLSTPDHLQPATFLATYGQKCKITFNEETKRYDIQISGGETIGELLKTHNFYLSINIENFSNKYSISFDIQSNINESDKTKYNSLNEINVIKPNMSYCLATAEKVKPERPFICLNSLMIETTTIGGSSDDVTISYFADIESAIKITCCMASDLITSVKKKDYYSIFPISVLEIASSKKYRTKSKDMSQKIKLLESNIKSYSAQITNLQSYLQALTTQQSRRTDTGSIFGHPQMPIVSPGGFMFGGSSALAYPTTATATTGATGAAPTSAPAATPTFSAPAFCNPAGVPPPVFKFTSSSDPSPISDTYSAAAGGAGAVAAGLTFGAATNAVIYTHDIECFPKTNFATYADIKFSFVLAPPTESGERSFIGVGAGVTTTYYDQHRRSLF